MFAAIDRFAVALAMLVLGLAGCSSPDAEFPMAPVDINGLDLGGLQEPATRS